MHVSRGIEDALAPEHPMPTTPARLPELCPEARVVDVEQGIVAHCQKRRNHDDPFAEVGSHRRDPDHEDYRTRPDGLVTIYRWRTT